MQERNIKKRKPLTPSRRLNLSEKLKQFYLLHPEARNRISLENKLKGKVPPSRKGTKITDKHKAAISKASTGPNNANWKGGYENKLQNNRNYRAIRRHAEGKFTHEEWSALKEQFGCKCAICEKPEPLIKLTADHVIPLSKGGSNWISNIQPLCKTCNSRKYNFIWPRCG